MVHAGVGDHDMLMHVTLMAMSKRMNGRCLHMNHVAAHLHDSNEPLVHAHVHDSKSHPNEHATHMNEMSMHMNEMSMHTNEMSMHTYQMRCACT